MPYHRTIVILAASARPGGYCFAGIDLDSNRWIRPISARQSEEVAFKDALYDSKKFARVGDVATIRFLERRPNGHQKENHVFDGDYHWNFERRATYAEMRRLAEQEERPVWTGNSSSGGFLRNRVLGHECQSISDSLRLLRLTNLRLEVVIPWDKKKLRGSFGYAGIEYGFHVTDPSFSFLAKNIPEALACISLSGLYRGDAYKLVAGLILP